MLAHRYQIFKKAWGNDLDESDPTEKRLIGIVAVAKRNRDSNFEVFNELVAMRLGQLMGLPIPSGMIVENTGCVYFASCHILAAGGELPEADLERFAKDKRREACGTMIFDAWVGNGCNRRSAGQHASAVGS